MLLYKLYKIVRKYKDSKVQDKANNHWFARAIQVGEVSTNEVCEQIGYATTVTAADVKAVVKALGKVMHDNLINSYSCRLDGLGLFKVGIKTVGAETPAEFTATSNIEGVHINFYPARKVNTATGVHTIDLLQGLKIQETPENKVIKQ